MPAPPDDPAQETWELLVDGRSITEVAAAVADETNADRARVEADVRSLVEALVGIGALVPQSPRS